MKKGWLSIAVALAVTASVGAISSQTDNFTKNFNAYKEIAFKIDFYAGGRGDVAPFEKPVKEARERLAAFLGNDLPRGAVVICSSLEQRDTVSEARLLRMGYRWVLIELTPEAAAQQMIARIKAQSGGQVPAGLLERLQNRTPERKAADEARLVNSVAQRMAYALVTTTLAPDKPYRSSRADDVGRSPLPDWLDVGIASYAAGGPGFNVRFLKDRLDEAFPLEDVVSMSRPFVVPGEDSGGGDRFFMRGGQGGGGSAPAGPGSVPAGSVVGGGQGRGGGMNLPKDVQDRMMFDAEASSFFAFIIEKAGLDKVKRLVDEARQGREPADLLGQQEMLGRELEKIEEDWRAWVKDLKVEPPPRSSRSTTGPGRPPG